MKNKLKKKFIYLRFWKKFYNNHRFILKFHFFGIFLKNLKKEYLA